MKKRKRENSETFLSLPERPVEAALGRSPGLGLNLLAAPSRPSGYPGTVTCVRLSSPSQWRDRAGFTPDFPDALERQINEAKITSRKILCQVFLFLAVSLPFICRAGNLPSKTKPDTDQQEGWDHRRNGVSPGPWNDNESEVAYNDAKRTKLKVSFSSITAPRLSGWM